MLTMEKVQRKQIRGISYKHVELISANKIKLSIAQYKAK